MKNSLVYMFMTEIGWYLYFLYIKAFHLVFGTIWDMKIKVF